MAKFAILDPRNLPRGCDNAGVSDYGLSELTSLVSHYGGLLEPTETELEWAVVRCMLPMYRELSAAEFYHRNVLKLDLYPNMRKLYALALLMPTTSVDCERGFSAYNSIKTDQRASLSVESVNTLMMQYVEGPAMKDFEYERAFAMWINMKDMPSWRWLKCMTMKTQVQPDPRLMIKL